MLDRLIPLIPITIDIRTYKYHIRIKSKHPVFDESAILLQSMDQSPLASAQSS